MHAPALSAAPIALVGALHEELAAVLEAMPDEQRLPTRTPESRAFAQRVHAVMALTSRLNALPFEDVEMRTELLGEIHAGVAELGQRPDVLDHRAGLPERIAPRRPGGPGVLADPGQVAEDAGLAGARVVGIRREEAVELADRGAVVAILHPGDRVGV